MRLRRLLLCLLVTGLLVSGIAWLNNNCSIRPLSRAQFLGRLDNAMTASRQWVLAVGDPTNSFMHEESAMLLQNPALMHMVADCALISGDEHLRSLAAIYFRVNRKPYRWG